jgi:ABC-2 type transport system permease protein
VTVPRLKGGPWRAARITTVTELTQTGHVASRLVMLLTQVLLVWWLWRALYAGLGQEQTGSRAGLDHAQAVTYALLGVLYMQFRVADRWGNGDSMMQLMFRGTIAYWFLRPVSPRRYYLIRAVGDLVYAMGWGGAGYLVFLAFGMITGPASAAAGLAAAATMALGLVVLYYLQLLVDLMSFWTVRNDNAVTAIQFVQNLLAGAFAPLWFFPAWFRRADALLPFQSTLNVPLSLYIGRVPVSSAAGDLAVQAAWCAGLAVLARLVWRRAYARVTVLGG